MSNDVRDIFKKINELSVEDENTINLYDSFDIELNENFVIETGVVGFMEDGVIVEADESMLEFLDFNGVLLESEELDEGYSSDYYPDAETNPVSNIINKNTTLGKRGGGLVRVGRVYEFSPKGKEFVEMRWNDGTYSTENVKDLHFISGPYENKTVGDVFNSLSGKLRDLDEAEYQGRKVSLGKPFLTPDGPKKRSVYVKKPNGNVVKVNFGDKNMRIKKSNPNRRKSFRARHNCANPGPRWKARFWSCRAW